jgi:peptide deformylase
VAILPIRRLGDPVLKTPAEDIETFDDVLRRLAEDMFETMYDAPGVGLAAPQIGLSLRLFVYDDGQGSKGALANPTLTLLDGELVEDEGCLSIRGLYYETPRAALARVEGQDLEGEPTALEGEGLLARIFQHETDHLAGMLFLDRLTAEDRRRAMALLRDQELGVAPRGAPRKRPEREP